VQKPVRPDRAKRPVPHPELLNDSGDVINEPLLVMRSISIKDAREQLNALYESSSGSMPGGTSGSTSPGNTAANSDESSSQDDS